MRHALVFNMISLVTFLAAVFFLATRGLNLGVDSRGGTVIEVDVRAGRRPHARAHRHRQAELGEYPVQNFGSSDTRADPPAAEGRPVDRAAVRARDGGAARPTTRGARSSASSSSVRRSARSCTRTARSRCCSCRSASCVPGVALRVAVRRRGHHRQPARRRHHPGLLRALPVGVLAAGAGRGAGGAGLLGQRVGGHRRPDPRELPQDAQGDASRTSSTTRSPARSRARSSPTAVR